METIWMDILWRQFEAAIDALGNAIKACPETLWGDRSRKPEFWQLTYHTLFWTDFYLSGSPDGFMPPPPFGLEELDPAGAIPERVYTRGELLTYLEHCRGKCRKKIEALTDETIGRRFQFGSVDLRIGELMMYNMRHVQHGAAQLNLILRQVTDSAPGWVFRAKGKMET